MKREMMSLKRWKKLALILKKSPAFLELSIKERETLIKELLRTYPGLAQHINDHVDVGYEASWLADRN
jgi:hypothetical protein